MATSVMFYGHYSSAAFTLGDVTFDFPLAYFLVMVSVFMVSLVAVVFSSAKSFDQDVGTLSDNSSCVYNSLLFSSFDHKIYRRKAVQIQKNDILGKLKVTLTAAERLREHLEMNRREKWRLFMTRLGINLFVLICLSGAAYGIYILTGVVRRKMC